MVHFQIAQSSTVCDEHHIGKDFNPLNYFGFSFTGSLTDSDIQQRIHASRCCETFIAGKR